MRKAGDFIGETFLSADADYPLTAEAVEDCLLCGFTKERFERLVTEHPNIGLQIMRNMSERISWLTSRVGSASATHLEERLYAVLVTVAREHGTRTTDGLVIEFPLTHEGSQLPRRGTPRERHEGAQSLARIRQGRAQGQASHPARELSLEGINPAKRSSRRPHRLRRCTSRPRLRSPPCAGRWPCPRSPLAGAVPPVGGALAPECDRLAQGLEPRGQQT